MSRKNQDKKSIGDKIIYNVKTPNGWSIIIMPDNILIDNYHIGKAHIHPNPKKHSEKIEISKQNQNEVFEIIKDYLQITSEFNINELAEMLK